MALESFIDLWRDDPGIGRSGEWKSALEPSKATVTNGHSVRMKAICFPGVLKSVRNTLMAKTELFL